MFGYKNKVHLDIEIEFIKDKFVFSIVKGLILQKL